MTNTHINFGGHKVTTNKVGQVHTTTTLQNGFEGEVKWVVVNGICILDVSFRRASVEYTETIVCSGIPKAKTRMANDVSGGYRLIVNEGETDFKACCYIADMYSCGELTYPVADDWVES